ncbi:MAG: trypsin-like peptidase domain-containing protein [Candidatus Vogelbacteria bacterium]|nr:trypsin-like peptidase domain-containing protein [Candidatus Vogelbacteria bacterium]
MEELNKTQLMLLAIFLSFITSLATGIVTVTLLEQTPVAVSQTINRVIEKTVERVVPGENKITTTIKQVFVPAEDPIASAINKSKNSFVKIELSVPSEDFSTTETTIVNLTGVFVSKDGYILAPSVLNDYASMAISVIDRNANRYRVAIVETKSKDYSVLKIDPQGKKLDTIDFAAKYPALGSQVIGYGFKSKIETLELGRIIVVDNSLSTTSPVIWSNLTVNWPLISDDGLLLGLNHRDGKITFIAEIDALLKATNLQKSKLSTDNATSTAISESQNATILEPLINIRQ